MLRQKVLIDVLKEATTEDIIATQLLGRDGLLLAFSGRKDERTNVSTSLTSAIWTAFDKNAAFPGGSPELKEYVMECENGFLVAGPVANMILLLHASPQAKVGMVRAKLHAMQRHMEAPLAEIARANAEEEMQRKRAKQGQQVLY